MNPFLPHAVLLALAGIQLALLLLKRAEGYGRGSEPEGALSFLGLLAAFVAGVLVLFSEDKSLFGGMLRSPVAVRPMFAAAALVAVVVQRAASGTGLMPANRKPEIYFILTLKLLLGLILLCSEGYFVSFLCMYAMGWLALSLLGATMGGRRESEALQKYWYQLSLAGAMGLLSLLVISVVCPTFLFSDLARELAGQRLAWSLPISLLLLSPFFLLVGMFPFHFIVVDRDHGAPWVVQMSNSLLVSAAGFAAILKMLVVLYGGASEARGVLSLISFLGFLGAFWGVFGALTQLETKRLLAFLFLGIWSGALGALGNASALNIAAAIYYLVVCQLSGAILYWTLGFFHERLGHGALALICGAGRHRPGWGALLLVGLASFLFVPPLPGFSLLVNVLGAAMSSGWPVLFAMTAFLLLLAGMGLYLLAEVFFRRAMGPLNALDRVVPAQQFWPDRFVQALLILLAVSSGLFWDVLWSRLMPAAEALIRLY